MAGWFVGIFMAIVSIVGLLMASHGVDSVFSAMGMLFFISSVFYIFNQMSRNIG